MKKFNPRCMTTDTQMAINNRNQLMPCCYIDTPFLVEDPTIKKLLSVSNISEHKSIKERLPEPCIKACLDFGKEKIRKEEWQT